MTEEIEQIIVFGVMGLALVLFIWGRWRYDLVALLALLTLVFTGIVSPDQAFASFGHPAVITVAAVLVVSRALRNAGVGDILMRCLTPFTGNPTMHIVALMCIVTVASAFMNNVGALALMMPVALESARKTDRSPAMILMPLSFAAILGGMITMIGTPPNIIIANFRAEVVKKIRDEATGEMIEEAQQAFGLFDFTLVGSLVAAVGVFFVAFAGWRLIPRERRGSSDPENIFRIEEYITEVRIPKDSDWIGKQIGELEALGDGDVTVAGMIRKGKRRLAPPPWTLLKSGDVVILKADPAELPSVVHAARLELVGDFTPQKEILRSAEVGLIEAVVQPDSALIGRTPRSLRLRSQTKTTNLLAIARQGKAIRRRLKEVRFRAGDVLLIQGEADTLAETVASVGLLPLARRHLQIGKRRSPQFAVILFALALILTGTGIVPAAVAITAAVVIYALLDYVSVRAMYETVDWSVLVLLGAMLPVGDALQTTGGTDRLASGLLYLTSALPVTVLLGVVLVVTMTLSDMINNAATAVVMAPLSVTIADKLGVNSDPFLMAVAVGASCAFLTPIGHQCNTLVLGPGGYRFGDYWRVGLPLEIIIVMVAVPAIVYFWPLSP